MKTKIITCFFLLFLITVKGKSQTLDQSDLNYNSGMSARTLLGYSHWQSFTAGVTGTLSQIDLGFFTTINGFGMLDIYAGAGVGGTLLQSQTINVICGGGNCLLSFSTSVTVMGGQEYTFHFTPGAGMPDPYGVQVEIPGTYPGGEFALVDPSGTYLDGWDMVFQTWVNGAVDVAELGIDKEITLFPNPVADKITVAAANNKQKLNIKIYNLLGDLIYHSEIKSNRAEVIISELYNGIYFYNINGKQGKVVVNR